MRKKRVINWMVILSILLTGCKQKKDTLQNFVASTGEGGTHYV